MILDAVRWVFSAWEEKADTHRRLSMLRLAVSVFTVAYVQRLMRLDALGWPDAFLAFVVLFAIPIGKALDKAAPAKVLDMLTGMFGKGRVQGGGSMYAQEATLFGDDRFKDDERG